MKTRATIARVPYLVKKNLIIFTWSTMFFQEMYLPTDTKLETHFFIKKNEDTIFGCLSMTKITQY